MKKYTLFSFVFIFSFILLGFNVNLASAQVAQTHEAGFASGCLAGDMFSRTTGQACATTTILNDCALGDMFSSVTGAPCSNVVNNGSSSDNSSAVSQFNTLFQNGFTISARTNNDVKPLQQFLKDQGYYFGNVDGKYGRITARAVSDFKGDNNLTTVPQSVTPISILPTTSTQSPVISGVNGPQSLNVNQQGTWSVQASDPNGGNLSYEVVWGDQNGYRDVPLYGSQTSTFTHTYLQSGNYTPTFTVRNSSGYLAQTSLSVNVGNATSPQCPVTYTCTPIGSTPICPVGYTCTSATISCPSGYTCTTGVINTTPSITVTSPSVGALLTSTSSNQFTWSDNLNPSDFDYYYVGIGSVDNGMTVFGSDAGLGRVNKSTKFFTVPSLQGYLTAFFANKGNSLNNNFFVEVEAYKQIGGLNMFDDKIVATGKSSLFSINNATSACTTSGFDPATGWRCGCTSTSGYSSYDGSYCGSTNHSNVSITSMSPQSGMPSGTKGVNDPQVTIYGSGFTQSSVVLVGDNVSTVTPTYIASDGTKLIFTFPADALLKGIWSVRVSNVGNVSVSTGLASNYLMFTITAPTSTLTIYGPWVVSTQSEKVYVSQQVQFTSTYGGAFTYSCGQDGTLSGVTTYGTFYCTYSSAGSKTVTISSNGNTLAQKSFVVLSSTSTQPSIKITSPNSYNSYNLGDTVNINWQTNAPTPSSTSVNLVAVGQNVTGYLIAKNLPMTGSYSKTIPTFGVQPGSYTIYAVLVDRNNQVITADSVFGYVTSTTTPTTQPSVTILSPNGGETYKVGDTVNIRWNTSNFGSLTLWLTLADKSGTTVPGGWLNASNIPNTGSYSWTIPNGIISSAYSAGSFRIVVSSFDNGPSTSDLSDSSFTITSDTTQPSITVSSAGTGDIIVDPSKQSVSNAIFTAKVSGGSGQYQYYWNLGDGHTSGGFALQGNQDTMGHRYDVAGIYTVSVYVIDSNNKTSNTATITRTARLVNTTAPSITVLSPNGGETYQIGGQMTVRWSTNNYTGANITLVLRRANTLSTFPADSGAQSVNVPNTGSYTWTIGNIGDAGQYYLRVICVPYSACNFIADSGLFTITAPTISSANLSGSIVLSASTASQNLQVPTTGASNLTKTTYNFISTGGTSNINELKFYVNGTNTVSSISVGGVSAPVVNGVAWFTGLTSLNLSVPNGGAGLNQDVFISYNGVGPGGVSSGAMSSIALISAKYSSNGTTKTSDQFFSGTSPIMTLVSPSPTTSTPTTPTPTTSPTTTVTPTTSTCLASGLDSVTGFRCGCNSASTWSLSSITGQSCGLSTTPTTPTTTTVTPTPTTAVTPTTSTCLASGLDSITGFRCGCDSASPWSRSSITGQSCGL